MSALDCVHEEDVRAAVQTGRWPERVDAELRAHIENCDVCQDTVAVTLAFLHVEDLPQRPLPDSATVWWKAQRRARAEATHKAQQPISVFQAVAFAAIVGLLSAILGASSTWLQGMMTTVGSGIARLDPRGLSLPGAVWSTSLSTVLAEHVVFVSAIALVIAVTPVAIYWATREN